MQLTQVNHFSNSFPYCKLCFVQANKNKWALQFHLSKSIFTNENTRRMKNKNCV